MVRRAWVVFLFAVVMATAATAANLDLTPLQQDLQFSFENPGARALGMGGAFIGAADDASAVEANPAGLTAISSSEITLEVRRTERPFTIRTGIGSDTSLTSGSSRRTEPTFASFAKPWHNFVFAAYYNVPLSERRSITLQRGLGEAFEVVPGLTAVFGANAPGHYQVDYRSRVFGAAGALHAGGLSVGLTVRYQRVTPSASGDLFPFDRNTLSATSQTPNRFVRIDGEDSKINFTAGVKWATESENFSVGAVYKQGSDYSVKECQPATADDACSSSTASARTSTFEIPKQYGAGLSVKPHDGLRFNADVVKINYSALTQHFTPAIICAATLPSPCKSADALGYRVPDATEIHFGGEWQLPKSPIALRAGWWHDPSHALQYRGPTDSTDPLIDAAEQVASLVFPGGRGAENHVSAGIGYLGGSFEVNAAYDHSSHSRVASISFLKRFYKNGNR